MRFVSMGIHRNALWLFNIAVSLIFLTGVNRIQGAVSSYPSLSQRYASLADRAIPGYKINPKPCRVKGREGTCMFVWECIKTEGQALGMCVEGFMFGSCCAHDVDNNVVPNSNPNQAEHSAPVSTTLFGLPTRPVTVPPHQLEMEKQGEEDSAQEITMAPSLITSRPLVVDMAAVTVEPVETTAPSVWQRPTVTSTTTTTTTRPPTTTERKVVTWVQSTSAPLASNAGTEQQQLGEEVEETFASTYLLETTTPTAPVYQSSTSHPPTTLPITTNASHIVLTNSTDILETTIPSNLNFTMTDVPLTLFSTLHKDAGSQTGYAVADEPLTLSIPTTTWSPASIMTTSMLTRPGTDVIKPNQNKNPNYHPFYVVRTKPTARPSPTTTTTVKTKVTLGGQRRPATTVRPLRRTTMLPVVTQATIQRFTPTKSNSTYRPKTSAMSTSTTTVAPQDRDATTAMVLTMESVNTTTFSMPTSSAISTSTLYSVLDSTVSPAQVSLPEIPPLNAVSPPPSEIPIWFTEEPTSTSTARSPSSSFGTTPAFTTERSTLSSTSSSTPSTSPDPSSTMKRPVTAQLPTSQSVPAQSTPNPTTVTTAMIPTVSMITDNAWTPITQASNSPSTTTIASTIASSTGTPLSTQPSRFPPFSPVTAIPSNDLVVECGVPQPFLMPELRIVGGRDATFGAWPWQVSVRRTSFFGFSSTHRCGGALLNEQWIITAGHCVEDLLINQIRLRLGEYDFASTTEPYPYIEKGASKKVVHPKYNFFTYEYDLALVRLEEPINFMPHIKPICLPAIDELMVGENATVTGWGRLSEGGTLPSKLQQVTVPIVSNEKCKNMFLKTGRNEYIPEIFMCAGYEDGGRDSCQGDSGGPLQARGKDGRYFLAGIISWGIGCAEKNLPGVCTRISKFTSWILENAT